MSDITKQYFDKQLNSQTKEIKSHVDHRISSVEEKLETKIETEIANLARMTANSFEEIKKELDVKKDIDQLKFQMSKVWSALNIKN